MQLSKDVLDIYYAKEKTVLSRTGALKDSLRYGFSYIEFKDHFVKYVITNSSMMKKIIKEVDDSKIDLKHGAIGTLWTAELYVYDKVKDNQVLLANESQTEILNLNVDRSFNYADVRIPVPQV